MLSLKQALGLNNIKSLESWTPNSEGKVSAWYQADTGIVGEVPGGVSSWADSANNHDMVQLDTSEQPIKNAGVGTGITFDGIDDNLQTTVQMGFSGAFTIGIKLNIAAAGGILIGDNTETGEFFKLFSSKVLRIKIDNATAEVELDSGTWGDGYMVVTRNASNVITLWWNGVQQTTATPTLSGTANIDTIGVRKTDLNPYDGTMYEIQIFGTESTALTTNVNNRLANL